MESQLPKCYRKSVGLDRNYLSFREEVWKNFANKKVQIIPSQNGYNSFKELEKYVGHIGKVYDIEFSVNGRAEYIYITGCPLVLGIKNLKILGN